MRSNLEGPGRRTFEAGHESAGVTTPATSWFLPEGATGDFFDTFILVANPTGSDALVRVTFLLADGRTFARDLSVSARARTNIWADLESFDGGVTFPLADAAFSTTLASLTGVPIVVERSMWWPGPTFASWREAHNSFGSSQAGTLWAGFGDVAANGPGDTYFLVANASATAATVAVTLAKTSGAVATKTFTVAPHSRFNVSVASEFPALVGAGSFGAVVESLGTVPTEIVVERATYTSEPGLVWSAGTGSLLTRIR